jgi:hypothetical protein
MIYETNNMIKALPSAELVEQSVDISASVTDGFSRSFGPSFWEIRIYCNRFCFVFCYFETQNLYYFFDSFTIIVICLSSRRFSSVKLSKIYKETN